MGKTDAKQEDPHPAILQVKWLTATSQPAKVNIIILYLLTLDQEEHLQERREKRIRCICSTIYTVGLSLFQYVAKVQARKNSTAAWWEELGCEIAIPRSIPLSGKRGIQKIQTLIWSSKMPNYGMASPEQLPVGVDTLQAKHKWRERLKEVTRLHRQRLTMH